MFNADFLEVRTFFLIFVCLILQQNANTTIKRERPTIISASSTYGYGSRGYTRE